MRNKENLHTENPGNDTPGKETILAEKTATPAPRKPGIIVTSRRYIGGAK